MGYTTQMSALSMIRSVLHQAYEDRLLRAVQDGLSIEAACEQLEMPLSTGYLCAAFREADPAESKRLRDKARSHAEAEGLINKGAAEDKP